MYSRLELPFSSTSGLSFFSPSSFSFTSSASTQYILLISRSLFLLHFVCFFCTSSILLAPWTPRVRSLRTGFGPYTRSPDLLLRRSATNPSTPKPSAVSKNLALDTSSRDSFHSCPDLSTLQISRAPVSEPALGFDGSDGLDQDTNTEPYSRSPTPDRSTPRGLKKGSTSRAVSKKARGVIGKVRALQRIAAAKMAHPTIKIDTNVHATKRGPPVNVDAPLDATQQGSLQLDAGNTEDVPPFLCQSVSGT